MITTKKKTFFLIIASLAFTHGIFALGVADMAFTPGEKNVALVGSERQDTGIFTA